jgi:hypothetical protein
MKKIISFIVLVSLLFFSFQIYASKVFFETSDYKVVISDNNVNDYYVISTNPEINYSIISHSDACLVLEGSKNGFSWYEVVATIATNLIPTTAYGLCMATLKNPTVCKVVYTVSEALVNSYEKDIKKGFLDGIEWIANKGSGYSKSTATIKTRNRDVANGSAIVFNEYRNQQCMKYSSVTNNLKEQNSYDSNIDEYNNSYNIKHIENFTNGYVSFEISWDGIYWNLIVLNINEYYNTNTRFVRFCNRCASYDLSLSQYFSIRWNQYYRRYDFVAD